MKFDETDLAILAQIAVYFVLTGLPLIFLWMWL